MNTIPMVGFPQLRLAEASDIQFVFSWRNDPWIVSLSTSQRTVTWEEHQAWYSSVLDRQQHLLFIIDIDKDIPGGTVRVDKINSTQAVITIYLLKQFTGKGTGPVAIDRACQQAFSRWSDLREILACIRVDNESSIKAFSRAAFTRYERCEHCPPDHVEMIRQRGERDGT